MSMFNPKSKKEEVVVVQQPVAVQAKDTRELKRLFDELGTFKWVGSTSEWDRCVEAIRKRILEMVKE